LVRQAHYREVQVSAAFSIELFVSFSRHSLTARLFERIEAQPLHVWNYDRASEALRPGEDVAHALQQRIDAATHYLVLVTDSAFENAHVPSEVERMLAHGRPLAVFVDSALVLPPEHWPTPFDALARRKFHHVDLANRLSICDGVQDLCWGWGVEYTPQLREASRMPVVTKLYEELLTATPSHPGRERDRFGYTVHALEEIQEALDRPDEPRASELMQLVILLVERDYPGQRLFYLRCLKGVYLARQGDALGALSELQASLGQARTPEERKLVTAATAYVHYQLEDFSRARDLYAAANGLPPDDAADRLNELLCRLRLGERCNVPAELSRIARAPAYLEDEPWLRLSRAFVHRLSGHPDLAAELLIPLFEQAQGAFVGEIAEELARVLVALGQRQRAAELLSQARQTVGPDVRILRALSLVHRGVDRGRHLEVVRTLARDHARDPLATFEALVGLWQLGQRDEASELGRRFLVAHRPNPLASYVCGAAHWLLGERALADLDFAQSNQTLPYAKLFA
jgi:tetratricopeptide (TPR) repeat protein